MFYEKFEERAKKIDSRGYIGYLWSSFDWLKEARTFVEENIKLFENEVENNNGFDIKPIKLSDLKYGRERAQITNDLLEDLFVDDKIMDREKRNEIIEKLANELRLNQDVYRCRCETYAWQVKSYRCILKTSIDNLLSIIYAFEYYSSE